MSALFVVEFAFSEFPSVISSMRPLSELCSADCELLFGLDFFAELLFLDLPILKKCQHLPLSLLQKNFTRTRT